MKSEATKDVATMQPMLTMGTVIVRPATDVRKGARVVALAGGGLSMRRPGRLPKGAALVHDVRWADGCRAGELTELHVGVAMAAKVARLHASRKRFETPERIATGALVKSRHG